MHEDDIRKFNEKSRAADREISQLQATVSKLTERNISSEKEISLMGNQIRCLRADLQIVQSENSNLRILSEHYRSHLSKASSLSHEEAKSVQSLITEMSAVKTEKETREQLYSTERKAFEEKIHSIAKERELDTRRSDLRLKKIQTQKEEMEVIASE